MTNADLLHLLSRLSRTAAAATSDLAYGAWNPNFCTADATAHALSICGDLRAQIDHIEKRCAAPKPAEPAPAE